MEDLGGIIALLGMILFVVAAVCLIRPIKKIKLGTRKRAGIALAVSIAMFIGGASLLPKPTPEEIAARDAREAQAATDRDAKAKTDEKALADRLAADNARNRVAITASAKGLWDQINVQVGSCDQAAKNVAEVAGRRNPDVNDLYSQVEQANELCRDAGSRVSDLDVPNTIPRNQREAFKKALTTCSNAYFVKASSFTAMGKVLDGDMRPSAVNEAKEASESSQAGMILCGYGFVQAVTAAGLDTEEVMGSDFGSGAEN